MSILKFSNSNIKISADLIYPVGSIYMSVNDTNPATLFGGTWEQIKDKFLLSCGDTYANGSTGGEATHTLKIDEMPKHSHIIYASNNSSATQSGSYPPKVDTDKASNWNANTITETGGSQPHNNMPPYLAVYVWKRTE